MRSVCLIFLSLLSTACNQEPCRPIPDQNLEEVSIEIFRMEKELFSSSSSAEILTFLQNNPTIAVEFLHIDQYPEHEILADRLYNLIKDPYIDTLYQEAIDTFDEFRFADEFGGGVRQLKNYYPAHRVPKIKTMVTGFYNDLYISDSLLVVGIDYFIGEKATYHPNDIPRYIMKRYTGEYLASTLLKFLINPLVSNGEQNTLLSEMIDHGKVYYFLSRLLPCTPDHLIVGFTAQQMKDVNENQEIIWASFLENEILYSTDEFTKVKFLGERPNVYEIGEKCPGRIGAWVGWQIVESYMSGDENSMQELLEITDNHTLFSKSGYKPRNSN